MIHRLILPLLALPLAAAFPSPQETLGLAWPGATVTRKEHYLTEAQVKEVRSHSGGDLSGAWRVAYEARVQGRLVGVAFFDVHTVRTQPETVMVAVNADGTLRRVEVVAFREPLDYLAKEAWIKQLEGRRLDADLSLKRGIRPLSGATLTANALVDAGRRCLALHRVLYGMSR